MNGVAATSDRFRITGVVLLPGTEAPSAARSPLIMRPFDQELVTCQRYYYKTPLSLIGYNVGGQRFGIWFTYPIKLRANPTISQSGGSFANCGTPVLDNNNIDGCRFTVVVGVTGQIFADAITLTADARL